MSDEQSKAWVWSQYRGELPAGEPAPAAADPAPAAAPAAEPPAEAVAVKTPVAAAKKASMSGLAIAAAVLVIAGLTWLFHDPSRLQSRARGAD